MKLKEAVWIVTCPEEARPSVRRALKAGRVFDAAIERRTAELTVAAGGTYPAMCTCPRWFVVGEVPGYDWQRMIERPWDGWRHYFLCPRYRWRYAFGTEAPRDVVMSQAEFDAAFGEHQAMLRAERERQEERRRDVAARRGWSTSSSGLRLTLADNITAVIARAHIVSVVFDDEIGRARINTVDGDEVEVDYFPVDADDAYRWRDDLLGLVSEWTVGS